MRCTRRTVPRREGWYYTGSLLHDNRHRHVSEEPTTYIQRTVIPRSEHAISRANISEKALKVLYRLHGAGYAAFLVGGGVRDLSLGREPKDFDVATDARPEEVQALFRNCRLIGRRFRLAHVHFGREIIEVATFRALHGDGDGDDTDERLVEDGRILRDNVYGSIEEDALRRDCTVNALYYNIADFSVVDFVGGMEDLKQGLMRLIGDPEVRYREDPVRMLRVVRFAEKLGFRIDPATRDPIPEMAGELDHIPPARLFEEVLKLFMSGHGAESFERLRQLGLFGHLFPDTEAALQADPEGPGLAVIARALDSTDRRVMEGRPVTPAFLFAALLWPAVAARLREQGEEDAEPDLVALQEAANEGVERQLGHVAIPKRFSLPMREIWLLQPRLLRRQGKRPLRTLAHPRFRAAYDFLLVRSEAGDAEPELAQWWTEFQDAAPEGRDGMLEAAPRKRRRRRRRSRAASGE